MKMKNQFGMFIHWGIYSLTGWQEQYRYRLGIDRYEYKKLMYEFNPAGYDPDEWVKEAKDAGMKYICFTAKHMDGFCMWDTKHTDFNIMNTPYGKDALKLLAAACERGGIDLSIYYSLPDLYHPNAYNPLSSHQAPPLETDKPDSVLYREYVRNQITELMTNYGKIYTLFWDIPPKIHDPSFNELVRKLQPGILINDRGYDGGDFSTPERDVPEGEAFAKLTEACQSLGEQSWGYRENEDYYTVKFLTQSMDKIMTMGGSYLLNAGPMPNGKFPEKALKNLRLIGSWYNRVKESFTDVIPDHSFFDKGKFNVTRHGGDFYLHFVKDPEACGMNLPPVRETPESVILLNNGKPVRFGVEPMPWDFNGKTMDEPYLHLFDLPADEFANETLVVKITFKR